MNQLSVVLNKVLTDLYCENETITFNAVFRISLSMYLVGVGVVVVVVADIGWIF